MMATLRAFSEVEFTAAKELLAARVATMLGRKMEEGDWSFVYCNAKRIPDDGWSNLNIDVSHDGMGVEHKMLCVRKSGSIKNVCGTRLMHPSATRSIRIPADDNDANRVAENVLGQYGKLIAERTAKVAAGSDNGSTDMRTGWLLWREPLDEFLYFEEPMLAPNPEDYYAEWNVTPAKGARKATRSLWIYDRASNAKSYSVTTTAGAKVQPYFDVPPPNDENLYYFRVQGNVVDDDVVEVWITRSTAKFLETSVELLDRDNLSRRILACNRFGAGATAGEFAQATDFAVRVRITLDAYQHLRGQEGYVSDEQMFQLFAQQVAKAK